MISNSPENARLLWENAQQSTHSLHRIINVVLTINKTKTIMEKKAYRHLEIRFLSHLVSVPLMLFQRKLKNHILISTPSAVGRRNIFRNHLHDVQVKDFKQEGQVALKRSPEFCLKLTYRYL